MSAQANTAVPSSDPDDPCNVVILRGTVRTEPSTVELDDGSLRVTFDVVSGVGSSAVPVTWIGRVSNAPRVRSDRPVALIGSVRRRFFQAGGVTQWRVDILASQVAVTPAKRRALIEGFFASALV